MFDDHPVFEHRDLGVAGALLWRLRADLVAHHHRPLDGLAPGQELRLAQDRRPAAAGVAAVPAALPLGLQPRRPVDALDLAGGSVRVGGLVPSRRPLVHDGVRRIVRGPPAVAIVPGAGFAAPPTTPPTIACVTAGAVLVAGILVGLVAGILVLALVGRLDVGVGGVVASRLAATSAATTTAPATAPTGRPFPLVLVGVGSAVVVLVVLVGVAVIVRLDRLRRHEQGQIVGPLGFGRGLENQPRLRLVSVNVGVDGKRVAAALFALGDVGQCFAQLLRLILTGRGLF